MRKINLLAAIVLSTSMIMSCGGAEESEDAEETEGTEETVEVTEDIELEPQTIEDLDNATFKQYWEEKGGILIDLRTPEELAGGMIEGAINIDFNAGDFDAAIDTLDPTVPTFVYCQGGGRSGSARDMLAENDFLEVYNLADGYGNWEE